MPAPRGVTCKVLKFSKQGSYQCKVSPVTEQDWADAHGSAPPGTSTPATLRSGNQPIADEVPEAGHHGGREQGLRLCTDHGIWSTDTCSFTPLAGITFGQSEVLPLNYA